ncbi:MAG: cytochrome D1 [Candidatus Tectomicrobia bacterium]|uniref:Cytochrome D1 n=1 Tax=Tectimicrobiota bacterium TaxID=2528274 RepID=A0A932CN43_UNCTE|nr:cytochrome D1 [Candidatus Tectomicrobia bacterium]
MDRVPMSRRAAWLAIALWLVWASFSERSPGPTSESAMAGQESGREDTSVAASSGEAAGKQGPNAQKNTQKPEASGQRVKDRVTREGLSIEFSADPVAGPATAGTGLLEGDYAEVAFRITDLVNGQPVQGLYPAAWMDLSQTWKGHRIKELTCKDRVGIYLKGSVGIRPMIDLNSYFILVMNRDATLSVIDPIVGITGKTRLYAQVILKRPGADWAKSRDDKRLFVTLPRAEEVAVVDTGTFKLIGYVAAGKNPVRIAMQPDQKYLWVGNDSPKEGESGVTAIEVDRLAVAARIPTGRGHHEIAFTEDSRYAFVSNRDSGTVSVIDVPQLQLVKELRLGAQPISLAFSRLSQALYVADAQEGIIAVVDGRRHEVLARIPARPGLGPLRFAEEGRWGLAVNPHQDEVYVIDASTNRLAHTLSVGAKPYQVSFSRAFAYVRSLGTERVQMVNLLELGKGRTPPVTSFAAGTGAPEKAPELGLADAIVPAPGEAAVLVVNPADNTVYYYMEGMNAPMGNFRNYGGHSPRAVGVVDRALKEKEPGVYAARLQIPSAGTYDVAFLLDSPRILHCFSLVARPNPLLKGKEKPLQVEYLIQDRKVPVGETVRLRFKLIDPATEQPRADLEDVRILYYLAPGKRRTEVPAQRVAGGIYEAVLSLSRSGAYYIYVASLSARVRYGDLPYLTLRAVPEKTAPAAPERSGNE